MYFKFDNRQIHMYLYQFKYHKPMENSVDLYSKIFAFRASVMKAAVNNFRSIKLTLQKCHVHQNLSFIPLTNFIDYG